MKLRLEGRNQLVAEGNDLQGELAITYGSQKIEWIMLTVYND